MLIATFTYGTHAKCYEQEAQIRMRNYKKYELEKKNRT